MSRFVKWLPPPWTLLYFLGILLSVTIFVFFSQAAYRQGGFAFDDYLLTLFNHLETPLGVRSAIAIDIFAISYLLGTLILIASVGLWRRSKRSAVFMTLGFWGAVLINILAKAFFSRARPELFEQLTPITNSSFPSGHAMGSFAFWLVALLVVRRLYPRQRGWIAVLGGIFAFSVGLSRVYLQVHYPSDVLAGWALSAAWVLGLGIWYSHPYKTIRNS